MIELTVDIIEQIKKEFPKYKIRITTCDIYTTGYIITVASKYEPKFACSQIIPFIKDYNHLKNSVTKMIKEIDEQRQQYIFKNFVKNSSMDVESQNYILEAIDKQIKKPLNKDGTCPSCGSYHYGGDYCTCCGQAIKE